MPNEKSHLSQANHNQNLLDQLVPKVEEFPDWVATVAFYKALHVVEAVLACESPIRHGRDHESRARILGSEKRHEQMYRNYRPLYAASMVARYMRDDGADFTSYLSPARVISELLRHRLHQVEKSALKQLKSPDLLVTCASRMSSEA